MKAKAENARCFPPFVAAYKDFNDIPTDLRSFKEAMKDGASEWGDVAVGRLFMNCVVTSVEDLEHTPIYIGYFGSKHYGVFTQVKDGCIASETFEIREYDYPQDWDVT